jgi:hypothetical protein
MKAHWNNGGQFGDEYAMVGLPKGCHVSTAEERGGWTYHLRADGHSNDSGIMAHSMEDAKRITQDAARSWFMDLGRQDAAEAIPD